MQDYTGKYVYSAQIIRMPNRSCWTDIHSNECYKDIQPLPPRRPHEDSYEEQMLQRHKRACNKRTSSTGIYLHSTAITEK